MLGGNDGTSSSTRKNDVWRSSDGEIWEQVTSAAAWSGRSAHTTVSHNGYIWVLGGMDRWDNRKNDVWRTSDGVTWEQVTPAAGWSARFGHTSVTHDGYLWVLGGYDSSWSFKNDVWRSSDGVTWEQVTSAAGWSARHRYATVSHNGYLWVLGGGVGSGLNDVWRSVHPIPPPIAEFNATPRIDTAPLTVHFTDESSNYPTEWVWNFGDGTTSTERNPEHTYHNVGTYTVSLAATNEAGYDTRTELDLITVTAPALPVVNFSGEPTSGKVPLTVQFTDESTGILTAWSWNFGDGTSSTEQNPLKNYTTAGVYTVSLEKE